MLLSCCLARCLSQRLARSQNTYKCCSAQPSARLNYLLSQRLLVQWKAMPGCQHRFLTPRRRRRRRHRAMKRDVVCVTRRGALSLSLSVAPAVPLLHIALCSEPNWKLASRGLLLIFASCCVGVRAGKGAPEHIDY